MELDTYTVIKIDRITAFENILDSYFKKKPKDCILYSKDGADVKIHKEVFGQTEFMRNILFSAKEQCCGIIEIICPCSKEILNHLVNFLYDGEIQCSDESESLEIIDNLCNIFGFPKNLGMNCIPKWDDSDIVQNSLTDCENAAIILPSVFAKFGPKINNFESESDFRESDTSRQNVIQNDEIIYENNRGENSKRSKFVSTKYPSNKYILSEQQEKKFNENARLVHARNEYYFNRCKICYKKFTTQYFLNKHVLSKHDERKGRLLKCQICKKSFVKMKSLKKHKMDVHKKENFLKKFKCTYCEDSFKYKWVLRNHVYEAHKGMNIDFEGM